MNRVAARLIVTALAGALSAAELTAQTPITFQYFYDPTGQLTKVLDSTGVVLEYVYDPVGNILEVRRTNVAIGQLTILGLTPSQGPVGATVEIQGQAFSPIPAANAVHFNGMVAAIVSATANRLLVLVPAGASTGPVTVTVGGNTATSPSPFTVLPRPLITSITPKVFEAAKAPSSIQVTGSNLTGATFGLLSALAPAQVVLGAPLINQAGTTATLAVTVAPTARGAFVLVATNALGSSDAFPNSSNTLLVVNAQDDIDSDGDGFPDGLELLFGSDPSDSASVPDLTKRGDIPSAAVSVLNQALVPTEHHLQSPSFSVLNTALGGASAQTLLSPTLSRSSIPITLPGVAAGAPQSTTTPVAPGGSAVAPSVSLQQPRDGDTVVEGQTLNLWAMVEGGQIPARLEFTVNEQALATVHSAPFEATFTVPSGVSSLIFGAVATGLDGATAAAVPVEVTVRPDPHTSITGRVVDANGSPIQGAVVDLLSEGLQAEFFDFAQALTALPDLTGRTPDRVTRVTAINTRNPGGVFGSDPFGLGRSQDYAARFSGWVAISRAGEHRFFLGTHEGARLTIGGVTVVDLVRGVGSFQQGEGVVHLSPGLIPIELTYYEGAGNPELQLSWTPPGGDRQPVLPSSLVPGWEPFVSTTDASGTFTIRNVPTALAGAQIRATATVGNQALSGLAVRVSPVPATEVNVGDVSVIVTRR